MHRYHYKIFSILLFICFLAFWGCEREEFYTGTDIEIGLSTDTLRIDTVFTSIGSSTRIVKVYNKKDQPILVDFALQTPGNSFFRFNANGVKGPVAKDIAIGAMDSVYLFVEVTIDPNQPAAISPYIIEDKLIITSNGVSKTLFLEAWGQNANYIPSSKKGGGFPYLSCDFGEVTWDDPRPYVLYGVLVIDSCTLVLPEGAKLYVHGGLIKNAESIYNDGLIVVQKNGKILSKGSVSKPVIIQGDRLETEFKEEKSQWVGILFASESKGNQLQYTQIKNSIIGVRADSLAALKLDNCVISNVGSSAVIGQHSTISATNCLFHSCGSFVVALTFGGNYDFTYCTMANFEGSDESLILTDFNCYDQFCEVSKINKMNADFQNCIVSGGNADEIAISRRGNVEADFQYNFDHCAFRIEKLLEADQTPMFLTNTKDCVSIKGIDKVFNEPNMQDFSLDTMSVLLGKGVLVPSISIDLIAKQRKVQPDMGCYEF
jgi:hypothetical protein